MILPARFEAAGHVWYGWARRPSSRERGEFPQSFASARPIADAFEQAATPSITSTSGSSSDPPSTASAHSTLPSATSSLTPSATQLTPSLILAASPTTSSASASSLGLFAARPLDPGTLLFSEPPLVTCSSWRDLPSLLSCATPETREAFWSLSNAFPSPSSSGEAARAKGVFDTNAFALEEANGSGGRFGVFRWVSRVNHSCAPNVKVVYVPARAWMEARVLRRIEEGEEVRSSYLPPADLVRLDKSDRRERLAKGWGFDCACEACERDGDDSLRLELRTILDSLPRWFFRPSSPSSSQRDPRLTLRSVARALDILDTLSLSPLCSSLFLLPAFKTCVAHHDMRSARLWARLALQVATCVEGEGGDGCSRWREWMQRPERALERGEGGKGWVKMDLTTETIEAVSQRCVAVTLPAGAAPRADNRAQAGDAGGRARHRSKDLQVVRSWVMPETGSIHVFAHCPTPSPRPAVAVVPSFAFSSPFACALPKNPPRPLVPAFLCAPAGPIPAPFLPQLSNASLFLPSNPGSASDETSISGSGRREKTSLCVMSAAIEICGSWSPFEFGSGGEEAEGADEEGESLRRFGSRVESGSSSGEEEDEDGRVVRSKAYGVSSFSTLPSRRWCAIRRTGFFCGQALDREFDMRQGTLARSAKETVRRARAKRTHRIREVHFADPDALHSGFRRVLSLLSTLLIGRRLEDALQLEEKRLRVDPDERRVRGAGSGRAVGELGAKGGRRCQRDTHAVCDRLDVPQAVRVRQGERDELASSRAEGPHLSRSRTTPSPAWSVGLTATTDLDDPLARCTAQLWSRRSTSSLRPARPLPLKNKGRHRRSTRAALLCCDELENRSRIAPSGTGGSEDAWGLPYPLAPPHRFTALALSCRK